MKPADDKSFSRVRRGASADAFLHAEIERLKKMTPLERANTAMGMGKIFQEGEPYTSKITGNHGR